MYVDQEVFVQKGGNGLEALLEGTTLVRGNIQGTRTYLNQEELVGGTGQGAKSGAWVAGE